MFTNGSTAIKLQERVHVQETASGAWLVRDERDRRGGRFADHRSALRFARREFGLDAEIVTRPPLTTPNARRLTRSHQLRLSRQAPMPA